MNFIPSSTIVIDWRSFMTSQTLSQLASAQTASNLYKAPVFAYALIGSLVTVDLALGYTLLSMF
ncbi:MAG: hypothetical protein ACRCXZ_09980 [Patescibacteria group bacterium]